jgi:HSP20 family protein
MSAEMFRFGKNQPPFRPIRELEEMRRKVDEDIVRPIMHAVWERIPEEAKTWSPSIESFEKGDSLVVKAELPGMKQEDIDVSATEDKLTIKGERRREAGVKEAEYHESEVSYGAFYRTLELPFNVDTKNIEAVYEDGILRITLQRVAGSKPKKVTIQVKKGVA